MKKVFIEGMMCNNCAAHAKKALETLGKNVEVSLEGKFATLETNASDEEIISAIEEAGYSVVEIING